MKAIMNINIMRKADDVYVAYGGQCLGRISLPCGDLPKEDYLIMRELERMAIDEFLAHVSSNGWIALYEDLFDIEEEAVLVNLTGYEAIEVDVSKILSEKEYEQAHLKRLEYALKNSTDTVNHNKE